MRVLFLPGISSPTEAWAVKVLAASGNSRWQSRVQRYWHWDGGNEEHMDISAELDRLRGEQADLLFGKSMGALLALMAVGQKLLKPAHVPNYGRQWRGILYSPSTRLLEKITNIGMSGNWPASSKIGCLPKGQTANFLFSAAWGQSRAAT